MKRIVWCLKNAFDGQPKVQDLELVEEELPKLTEGQVTIEAVYLSPDPYQRLFSAALKPPCVMMGTLVAKVVRSKNENYPIGSLVASNHGWILRDNVDPNENFTHAVANFELIDPDEPNPSYFLSLYGLTGLTAYFALLEICRPQKAEVVFVNSAAGAVGHIVAQIAKILGCRVIGTAGSDEKCRWLQEEVGLDRAYNYKKENIDEALKRDVPEGIDCFYDNVGGAGSVTIFSHMKLGGRVALVGTIDSYNSSGTMMIPDPFPLILGKKLHISGFHFFDYMDRMDEGRQRLSGWVKSGQLKVVRETILNGFERMPEALIGLFNAADGGSSNDNLGKVIVKAYPD